MNKSTQVTERRLLQNHDTLIMWVQRLSNAVIIVATLLLLAWWRDGEIGTHYRYMAIISLLTTLLVYQALGVHRRFGGRVSSTQHLARAWGIVVIIVGWTSFLTKTTEDYSRLVIVLWVIIAFVLQACMHPIYFLLHKYYRERYSHRLVPALIIGTSDIAAYITTRINENVWLPDKIVGAIAIREDTKKLWNTDKAEVLGTLEDLSELITRHNIRRVYIAMRLQYSHLLREIQDITFNQNVDLIWAPDIFSIHLLNPSVRELSGVPLISLSETPLMSGGPAFIKAAMDKLIAGIALICLSPILIVTALCIAIDSKGPLIFVQKRHGWDGRVINIWKFRSMYTHQPETGSIKQATLDDPRITRVGRFIRRTSIDELPQLFNVLQGRMSLVGPRPHAVEHNNFYADKIGAYLARHRIKPGITGLAQIHGYRGETETLDKMEQRIQYDLEYINNWSPWLDLKILLKTPFTLFSKNAY